MLRKVLLGLAVVVVVIIVWQVIALLMLRNDVRDYAAYWQSRSSQPGEFVYVALGDSAAQGIGASKPEKSYVGLLAESIAQQAGQKVRVINLSVSGAKLQDLIDSQLPQLANYQPDLITMEIGANDMRDYDETAYRERFEAILQALPAERTVVSNMPYFGGIIRPGDSPLQASRVITQLTSQYGFAMAELYQPLQAAKKQWIYAADVFHPNDKGYRIWYGAFWQPVNALIDK